VRFDNIISWTLTPESESPPDAPQRHKYRIKFWNAGAREIFDVTISARLHIQTGTNCNSYSIPPGYASLPKIYPSRAVFRPRKWKITLKKPKDIRA
jgi:hypothetical protein